MTDRPADAVVPAGAAAEETLPLGPPSATIPQLKQHLAHAHAALRAALEAQARGDGDGSATAAAHSGQHLEALRAKVREYAARQARAQYMLLLQQQVKRRELALKGMTESVDHARTSLAAVAEAVHPKPQPKP